ncbi:MAG TPA: phosphate ABC transporter permease PstA [Acidimicrobiales bacterium]|nr:phosphate ABC transporter permease PstA [Acidimicrobiales bacterium]
MTALSLQRQRFGRRRVVNAIAIGAMGAAILAALFPLLAVLTYTARRGAGAISLDFFTHSMRGVADRDVGGGAYHAIIGTLEQVGLATLISVPVGLLVAIYLVEYGAGRLAGLVRFVVDVMTGVPSIVAGLFIYAFWVLALGKGYSGLAAAFALSVLMLPVVIRASEEMLKLVPAELREASYALGVPRYRTVLRVVLPAASAGLTTAVMLAVARVTGETAPLLLTAFGLDSINVNPFKGPQSSLPQFVYKQVSSPYPAAVQRAWAGALTLIGVVLALTVIARVVTRRNRLVS